MWFEIVDMLIGWPVVYAILLMAIGLSLVLGSIIGNWVDKNYLDSCADHSSAAPTHRSWTAGG